MGRQDVILNLLNIILFSQISNTVVIDAVGANLECRAKTKDVSFLFEMNFNRILIEFMREYFVGFLKKFGEMAVRS